MWLGCQVSLLIPSYFTITVQNAILYPLLVRNCPVWPATWLEEQTRIYLYSTQQVPKQKWIQKARPTGGVCTETQASTLENCYCVFSKIFFTFLSWFGLLRGHSIKYFSKP